MAIDGGSFWPIWLFLATRGPSLSRNWTNKSDGLGIIRGHIGIKLDKIGPWPYMEVPYGSFGFLVTRGPR